MKKILAITALVASIVVLSYNASAQISINGGYICQQHTFNINTLAQEVSQKDQWMHGGFVGASQNLPMFANVSMTPGAYISLSQMKQVVDGDVNESTTSDFSLKLPFLLNLRFDKMFVFGGPVFNVSLSTIKNLSSVANTSDIHFDMSAAAGAGVRFGLFHIYAGFNYALIDHNNFNYSSAEAYTAAWEGSTIIVGLGFSLSRQ